MLHRRDAFRLAAAGLLGTIDVSRAAPPVAPSFPAAARLNQPGPEAAMLASRTGRWLVTETAWTVPDAPPRTTTGSIAERAMIGTLLQETIRPPADPTGSAASRTDLLCFNRLEARWDYVSFDARDPDGIMVAWSRDRGRDGTITLDFLPFATPRPGPEAVGEFLRFDQIIRVVDDDHDVKEQFFTLADGTGTRRLGHRYSYTRLGNPA